MDTQDVIAKIPVQDTRLFYKRWENYENLNNLLLNEISSLREKDPKGMIATNEVIRPRRKDHAHGLEQFTFAFILLRASPASFIGFDHSLGILFPQ